MPHSVNNSTSTQAKMSRPSSTSTQPGNVFPKQAGAQLLSPDAAGEHGLASPSPSQFSFASSPQSVQELEDTAATGDSLGELRSATSRSRAQYYEESFSYRGATSSARDRVTKDAPIIADLRTNVIVSYKPRIAPL
jgi:predicted component of type VI protein secretion system